MTLGAKIKKYRLLKGITQKTLGAEVLKGKMNSDVRINQYERNFAAPKEEIRSKIANALDVDLPALSDVNIECVEDVMYVLFELEEKLGLKVSKENGKIQLSFDHLPEDRSNEMLLTYLNFWENEASKDHSTRQQHDDYMRWQGRFSSNINDYLHEKEDAINAYYKDSASHFAKNGIYAKTTSDIVKLLRKIIESGFTVSTRYTHDMSGAGYVFYANELLNPPTKEAAELFASFLAEIDHFNALGAGCYTEISMPDNHIMITYNIPITAFNVIKGLIDEFLDFLKKGDRSEFVVDSFEKTFEHNLEVYNNNIEEEITAALS